MISIKRDIVFSDREFMKLRLAQERRSLRKLYRQQKKEELGPPKINLIADYDKYINFDDEIFHLQVAMNSRLRLTRHLAAVKHSSEIAWAQWLEGPPTTDVFLGTTHLAEQFIEIAGLKDWKFEFGKSKNWLGICESRSRIIRLNRLFVLRDFPQKKENIRQVLLHEIAHAINSDLDVGGPPMAHFGGISQKVSVS